MTRGIKEGNGSIVSRNIHFEGTNDLSDPTSFCSSDIRRVYTIFAFVFGFTLLFLFAFATSSRLLLGSFSTQRIHQRCLSVIHVPHDTYNRRTGR